MGAAATWAVPSARTKYKLGTSNAESPLASIAGPSRADADAARPWHPDSPLLWAGGLIAVTFGLMAVSGRARVGPFRVSASAGKTEGTTS